MMESNARGEVICAEEEVGNTWWGDGDDGWKMMDEAAGSMEDMEGGCPPLRGWGVEVSQTSSDEGKVTGATLRVSSTCSRITAQ